MYIQNCKYCTIYHQLTGLHNTKVVEPPSNKGNRLLRNHLMVVKFIIYYKINIGKSGGVH